MILVNLDVNKSKEKEKKDEFIKIYMTEVEKQEIEQKADQEKMSVSAYCRRKLLMWGRENGHRKRVR